MPRPRLLMDLAVISKVVSKYKEEKQPTFAGYCRMLKCSPDTLYKRMNDEDDIAETLYEGWLHLLESWEKNLYNKDLKIPAMFYCKTIRRFGFRWNDGQDDSNNIIPNKLDINISIIPDKVA
jgi:hypothetical protein